jgi:hypothetical protein
MSRIYVCDRCKKQSSTWNTTSVKLPSPSFFDRKLNLELCEVCLIGARKVLTNFIYGDNSNV